jgi:small-conductance mechanosensitive channel
MNRSHLQFIPNWAPDWLVAVVALAGIAIITALVLGLIRKLVRRLLPSDRTLSHTVLTHAGGLAQFALTVLVAALVTPALPLDRGTNQIIERVLFAAFIVLMGWFAIVASDLAINRYMARFHSDTTDNLLARKAITQMKLLKRTVDVVIGVITVGFALMTFDAVRQFGVSLFASAGIAGIAVGFAAKPLLENLVAGVQLAITQPFRIDDVVIVNGEWGWIEEINSTYVVIRCWDWRRLVVPISYMMTTPFQNWTRQSSQLIGSVYLFVDLTADIERIRAKAGEVVKASPLWDGKVVNVQVTDVSERAMTMQIRILATSSDSGKSWDLRCEIREKLLAWMREEYPEALPRRRNENVAEDLQPIPQQQRRA